MPDDIAKHKALQAFAQSPWIRDHEVRTSLPSVRSPPWHSHVASFTRVRIVLGVAGECL